MKKNVDGIGPEHNRVTQRAEPYVFRFFFFYKKDFMSIYFPYNLGISHEKFVFLQQRWIYY